MITLKKFEEKYKEKGGMKKLGQLRALYFRTEYIAKHFGVTAGIVRQWMWNFFGGEYDPRPDIKDATIAGMFEFALHNTKEEVSFAFGGTEYYPELLKLIKERKVYED